MAEIKCVGILTSGGDAPGMNAAIRAVTRSAIFNQSVDLMALDSVESELTSFRSLKFLASRRFQDCSCVDKIRDTATSHERLFFIEVMGRDAGFLALNGAIA